MRLSNTIQKATLEEKLSRMRSALDDSIRDAGLDLADYSDVQSLMDTVPSMINIVEGGEPTRFQAAYRLWGSVPTEDYRDHWAYPFCTTTEMYMPIPIDELQGSSGGLKVAADTQSSGAHITLLIKKNVKLVEYGGCAQIMFTQVDPVIGAGVPHESQMTHPYVAACSLHELFKLLLEWQWAVLYAENTEMVGQIVCEFLGHLGLHVDDVDSNPVVRDLMSLPDMQVAQYIKTGECTLLETEPEMPLSFRLWAAENSLMEAPTPLLADLYKACVSYKRAESSLARL